MDSRPRKTTLETFNEELAVLDRPLEGDVEYFDERPPRRQGRSGLTAIVIGTVFFAGAGVLFFSHPDPETIIAAAQAAAASALQTPPPAAAPAAVEAPVVEAPVATAPVASAPSAAAEAEVEMDTANAPPKWRSPPRAAWAKLRPPTRRN